MKDNKGLTIILSIVAVILAIVAVMTVVLADNTGPKVAVEPRSITYIDGNDKTPLLDGVTAYDEKDGDVTDSLIVKDITVLNSGNVAKITYAARDKHNNISEGYRIVAFVSTDEAFANPEIDEEGLEIVDLEETYPEENMDIENNDESENIEESEDDEELTNEEAEEETAEEPKKEEVKREEPKEDDKNPSITLKQKSISIGIGQTFNPSDYIKSQKNVSSTTIDGNINVMIPGTYPLTFKGVGPDGKTVSETLTVVVK